MTAVTPSGTPDFTSYNISDLVVSSCETPHAMPSSEEKSLPYSKSASHL